MLNARGVNQAVGTDVIPLPLRDASGVKEWFALGLTACVEAVYVIVLVLRDATIEKEWFALGPTACVQAVYVIVLVLRDATIEKEWFALGPTACVQAVYVIVLVLRDATIEKEWFALGPTVCVVQPAIVLVLVQDANMDDFALLILGIVAVFVITLGLRCATIRECFALSDRCNVGAHAILHPIRPAKITWFAV